MGRLVFYTGVKRILKVMYWLCATSVTMMSVVVLIIGLSLSRGPVRIDFIIPYLEKQFQDEKNPITVSFDQAELVWVSKKRQLVIKAAGIHLQSEGLEATSIKIPAAELRYRLSSLAKLKLMPSEIEVINPTVKIYQDADGSYRPVNLTSSNHDWVKQLSYYKGQEAWKGLRCFIVKDLTVEIEDIMTGTRWDIPKVDLSIHRRKKVIEFSMNATSYGAFASAKGRGEFFSNDSLLLGMKVDIQGEVKNFPIHELAKFWPTGLAAKPRKWVLKNLTKGIVPQANIDLGMVVDLMNPNMGVTVNKIEGQIHALGMDVDYVTGMPHVSDVNGVVTYDQKNFSIDIHSGNLRDITIKGGNILIAGMYHKDQFIDINLDVEGSLKTGLDVLNSEPVNLDKVVDLNFKGGQGIAQAKLHFDFPLEASIKLDDVNVEAKAEVKDVHVPQVFGAQFPYNLEKGNLSLSVNRDKLEVQGKAMVAGIPCTLCWDQNFRDTPGQWRTKYALQMVLTSLEMKKLGIKGFFTGPISVDISLVEADHKLTELNARADFTKAEICLPGFLGVNKHGEAGHLDFKAQLLNGKLHRVNEFSVRGKNIQITADVDYDGKQHRLIKVTANNAKLGDSDFSFRLKQGSDKKYYCDITGEYLDAIPIIAYFRKFSSEAGSPLPLQLSFDFKKAVFENEKVLAPLHASSLLDEEGLEKFYLDANFTRPEDKEPGYLDIIIERNGDTKKFQLESNEAGEVLSLLGIVESVHQGKIAIQAEKKLDKPWFGKIKVKNFYITDAPFATQVLSMASPLGLLDVVSGRPITFDRFRALFRFQDDQLLLKEGRASGKSIGFTVDGLVDPKFHRVNLQGTILPYNAFNVFLVKIPFIGPFLGGEGGGLLGINYGLSGKTHAPRAKVNPLSALTPGFLRSVFLQNSDDFTYEGINNIEDEEEFFRERESKNSRKQIK